MHEGPIYGKRTGKEKENEHMRGRMGESRFRNVLYVLYGFCMGCMGYARRERLVVQNRIDRVRLWMRFVDLWRLSLLLVDP